MGFWLASGSHALLGLLLGAAVGFALGELGELRRRLQLLEREVAQLRRDAPGSFAATGRASARAPDVARSPEPMQSPQSAPPGPMPSRAPASITEPRPIGPSANVEPGGGLPAPLRLLRDYFTGGNTLVRVAVVILFFGVGFLLRYVAEHTRVPIALRLCGVALGALVLLALGWRLRSKRPGYALALQGGGFGILYLTVFAALRLYSLLSPGAAFGLFVALAAASASLAVLQSSQSFALLAVTGGFLAPLLASTGHGSHLVLFGYYSVLNAAILTIAWTRAWRALNLAGFLFTFVIATAWGVLSYRPELFATTEPFLILFFLMYVMIAVLFSSRQPPQLRGFVDGTLVFGTPMASFALQTGMLEGRRLALACSAAALAAFYLAVAGRMRGSRVGQRRLASRGLLAEAFTALGVVFGTLAVPFAFEGRWTAATWALEGAALVWVGCRQLRAAPRAFGAALQLAAGWIFWQELGDAIPVHLPLLNTDCLGGVLLSVAAVFSAVLLERLGGQAKGYEGPFSAVLFFWGLLWWVFRGLVEIQRWVPDRYSASASLVYLAFTALLSSLLCLRGPLPVARLPALGLLPVMGFYAALAAVEVHHPLADGGWFGWPGAFVSFYVVCGRHEGPPEGVLARSLHVGGGWLLVALLTWEWVWRVDSGTAGQGSWATIAYALPAAAALFAVPRLIERFAWPFGWHRVTYAVTVGGGLGVYLAYWVLLTNLYSAGDSYPFPYVPLLNPLDLGEGLALLVLLRYWLYLRDAAYPAYVRLGARPIVIALTALAFIWLNAVLLRTLHHWTGISYRPWVLARSTLVETSLSIFWTAISLATMLMATRRGARTAWLTGAGLLAAVILKLFIVDLSSTGTIERIVSFVGVGLLMLVIGYFSPLPPLRAASPTGARSAR